MKTLIQINSFDSGSTGNIAKQINIEAYKNGYNTYFVFGRFWKKKYKLAKNQLKMGNLFDSFVHLLIGRLFDSVGLGSIYSTKKLIKYLDKVKPDIIHLHNIHGYYINYPLLFKYIHNKGIPVVWTLHDCWSFTGHCCYFDFNKCTKWKEGCLKCSHIEEYPKSFFLNRSLNNYKLKEKYFTLISKQLTIVPVSYWLESLLKESFFKNSTIQVIHNGIDLNVFTPTPAKSVFEKYKLQNKTSILGVASPWSKRKGLNDFIKLRHLLSDKYTIILVGLAPKQIAELPEGIIGIERTQDVDELVKIYSTVDIFVNTTYEDNYPTVNLEAIACGTPVITYNTGGCSESINNNIGCIVEQGNIQQVIEAINIFSQKNRDQLRILCRNHAIQNFNKELCYNNYIKLYQNILSQKQ
jgi:putative colanic acid biosynthesis glycosyltransferase